MKKIVFYIGVVIGYVATMFHFDGWLKEKLGIRPIHH